MFVVKEFESERQATKFARGFDESRKRDGWPQLEVRGDAQTGKWVVVDPIRAESGEWPCSRAAGAEVTAREAQLGVQTLAVEDEYMR
jgi:hypothetical protein